MAVKLIHGTDEYLVSFHAHKAVDSLCPEDDQALGLETVNGSVKTIDEAISALKSCIGALRTVGLFGGQKTVWFRDVSIFKDKVLSKNENVKKLLDDLASDIKSGLSDDQNLIISTFGVDKRSAFYKACAEVAEVSAYDLPEQIYQKLPIIRDRAQKLFAKSKVQISSEALDLFLEKVGMDTRQLVMEAEKLILYIGNTGKITVEDVKAITSSAAEAITWDFTDALGERRLDEALKIFRQLIFQGESEVGIMHAIENLFQSLSQFRSFLDQNWLHIGGYGAKSVKWSNDPQMQDLFDQLPNDPRKMHWFRVSKLGQQAGNYTAEELDKCRQRLLRTHEQLVSSAVPKELLLEMLVIQLIAKA